MLNLIKKDIINFKSEGKSNLKYIFIFMFLYIFINPAHYMITNVFISYLIIANTFYLDYENNSKSFIKSMPTSMEDIVYSKYIMAAGLILITTTIINIIGYIGSISLFRGPVLNEVFISVNGFLMIISIVLPLFFRFGYNKVRFLGGFIGAIIFLFNSNNLYIIADKVYTDSKPNHFVSYMASGRFGEIFTNIIKNINTDYINLYTITIFTLLVFIISMFISLKIVKSKKCNY